MGKNIDFEIRVLAFLFPALLRYNRHTCIALCKFKVYNIVILHMYILKKDYHNEVS